MLKQLPFALTPELYEILYRMGHGDELVVADANFPADSCAKRLCTMPDMDTVQVLELVLNYVPVDTFTDDPIAYMEVAAGDDYHPQTWDAYDNVLLRFEGRKLTGTKLHRAEFYERTKNAYAVILTGERRRYGNIILRKGVVEEEQV